MKKIYLVTLLCPLVSCVESVESPDCTETGCDQGYFCDAASGLCALSCVESGCDDGDRCDATSGLCEPGCTVTGCDDDSFCDEASGLCVTDIAIPDAGFEACIRWHLGKYEGAVTVADVAGQEFLDCHDRDIADITGIEHFRSLTKLTLWENQIADLEPLAGLTTLTWLQLGNNQITNAYFVSGLTNLTRLGLAHNQILSVYPLADLENLKWLNLDSNRIIDAGPLADLEALTWLSIENNDLASNDGLSALAANGCEVYKHRRGDGVTIDGLDSSLRVDVNEAFARSTLSYAVAPDGEVTFEIKVAGRGYRVIAEYPGRIVLGNGELRYQVPGREITIGVATADDFFLCQGPLAQTCQFSIGKKSPAGLDALNHLAGSGEPVFSASLRLEPGASPLFNAQQYVYGIAFHWLDPYILASPNQFDAGSCNYMANTGAMEILMNQHTAVDEIEYDGDTDLSERYLMNASMYAPSSVVPYHITDLVYTYGHFGGALLSRDYPFAAGYVKENQYGQVVAAPESDPNAYFSCSFSWIDGLPDGWGEQLVPTPDADRTLIFVDPNLNDDSIWNVALMNDDVIDRIKDELRSKHAPVIVVYNHFLYWHATIVVGYDDNAFAGQCPMVMQSINYFRQEGRDYYADKITAHMDANGGCSTTGVFYVRDSIYDGEPGDPQFSYSDTYNFVEPYSARIIEHSYDWAKYLGNHAYSVHRK